MIHPYNCGKTQGIQQLFHNPLMGITTLQNSRIDFLTLMHELHKATYPLPRLHA